MLKKALLGILFAMLFLLVPQLSHAQELGDILNSDEMSQEKFFIGNTETSGLGDTFANFFSCSIAGCQDSEGNDAKVGFLPKIGQTLAFMYQKQPVSSREYLADLAGNIGLPTPQQTQAQGIGYKALEPMIPLWKAFRNLAYSLYIIIFAVIGFMIMFRTKVNAQTIISIQSAIPNLIITLILITFSYAIAGFLVDIMYFAIYFIVFLADAGGLLNAGKTVDHILSHNAWSMFFLNGGYNMLARISTAIGDIFMGYTLGDTWGKIIGGLGGDAIANSIAFLVVVAALAIQMLKLVWTLIQAYVMLLIMTITAPIQILFNALPGSNAFMTWLKKTASYLAPFPVVIAMFLFAAILIGKSDIYLAKNNLCAGDDACNPFGVSQQLATEDSLWLPPLISYSHSDIKANDLLAIIGFAVILMSPQAAKMAKDALQVKDSPYTAEIGAGIGAGTWYIRGIKGIRDQRKQATEQTAIYQKAMEGALKNQPTRSNS